MMIGRNRSRQAAWIASCGAMPCSRSASSAKSTSMMAFFFTMPISRMIPMMLMTESSPPVASTASRAPSPADGSVLRIVSGCSRLSYSTPRTM